MTLTTSAQFIEFDGPSGQMRWHRDPGTDQIVHEVLLADVYRLGVHALDRHVIDVGANVGVVTLAALGYGATHVTAVEPDAINYRMLRDNVDLNDAADRVTLHHRAVSDGAPGRVLIRDPEHSDGCYGSSFTIPVEDDPASHPVKADRLAAFLPDDDDDDLVLKIDTEGGEYDIVAGARDRDLERCTVILVEWHNFPGRRADASARLGNMVRRLLAAHDVMIEGPPATGGMIYAYRR